MQVSRLVVSEVVGRQNMPDRVACIEKWAAIADICRCMHNYNGVLQICAAFVNSSVYRLKKTWEKLSKQVKIHDFYWFPKLRIFSRKLRYPRKHFEPWNAVHYCRHSCVVLQTKQMIERLQTLVSSDGRFRNMRDALHRYMYE